LMAENTELVRQSPYLFHVRAAQSLAPADYAKFAQAQLDYQQMFWQREGDPRTLPARVKVRNFIGNALSVGALFIPAHQLGVANGVQVMANSGLAEDIGNLPREARAALVPAALPALDTSAYRQIEVRRVEFQPDTPGEIIIAYKTDKTPEAEQAALIKAIVTLAGADTTPDAVEAARQADYEKRVAVWDASVASQPDGASHGGI
jgi:hypothetical protein